MEHPGDKLLISLSDYDLSLSLSENTGNMRKNNNRVYDRVNGFIFYFFIH